MDEKVIISGAGGQGIMLLGKVLAEAALRSGKHLTWLPSYGAEVRGGKAYCMVVISDTDISSPYIDKADTLIAMNSQSLEKFRQRIKDKGLLIVNSSLAGASAEKDKRVLRYPFTDIAEKLGNIRVANMVALGFYLAQKKIISLKFALGVIGDIAPEGKRHLVGVNKQAISAGAGLVK